MHNNASRHRVNFALASTVLLVLAFWWASSDMTARWAGVPPVPTARSASLMTLGDAQLAYRSGALTLQALGDSGGRVVPLKDYDYHRLSEWFRVLNVLDPASDHVPMIAAYYFGASKVPSDIALIVDYLATIGDSPAGQKWRWLGHAAYLARHRMDNLDLALDLAYRLARIEPLDGQPLPIWARQMPVFVLGAKGDRAAAREMIEQMLATSENLHPNEVNFMKGYLAEQLGVPQAEIEQMIKLRGASSVQPAEKNDFSEQ